MSLPFEGNMKVKEVVKIIVGRTPANKHLLQLALRELFRQSDGDKIDEMGPIDGIIGPRTLSCIPSDSTVASLEELMQADTERYTTFHLDKYTVADDPHRCGMLKPDLLWEEANIITLRNLPQVGTVRVHRVIAPNIVRVAFSLAQNQVLVHEMQGYVPRRKMWDPQRDPSVHAWGLAVDIDPSKYPVYNATVSHPTDMNPRIVDLMGGEGFTWGGDWRPIADPMHFQLGDEW